MKSIILYLIFLFFQHNKNMSWDWVPSSQTVSDKQCCICFKKEHHKENCWSPPVKIYEITDKNTIVNTYNEAFKILSGDIGDSGLICESCVKRLGFKRCNDVKCYTCLRPFTEFYEDIDQALCSGCNSTVHEEYISCGYGSKYDASSAREYVYYTNSHPESIPYGSHLCDECIKELITNGTCTWCYA